MAIALNGKVYSFTVPIINNLKNTSFGYKQAFKLWISLETCYTACFLLLVNQWKTDLSLPCNRGKNGDLEALSTRF